MTDLTARLSAALADRYRIERQVGEGGMAFVYLAHDIRHSRMVAIKVLKPDLASSIGAERFLREIKSAAKLTHPHILPLFDSGNAEGMLYYVMPFVEGESLADYMVREKQLSIEEAVQITREVAEALSVAHSYGLVHRDIKPQNVMMTGGHALVADFGIALALDQAGGEKLTQTGMTIGTPAYMSPEQAAADPDLDGRADIYSLGCMFYEMLVGQIPFTAPTPAAMIAMHTMDHPTAVHIVRDSVPPDLENIVYVAMEKTPADRFRTAQHMVDALKAFEHGTATKLRTSNMMQRMSTGVYAVPEAKTKRNALIGAAAVVVLVGGGIAISQMNDGPSGTLLTDVGGLDPHDVAVLYFEDRSPGGDLAYLADGLTEGLIGKLAQVRGLTVVSQNGVAGFRGTELRLDAIARELDVGSIVTGAVAMVGNQLEIEAHLIDGNSGSRFDDVSFRLPADDVIGVQDSLAENVSAFLRRSLGEEVRLRDRKANTASPQAWSLVQQGERLRKEGFDLEFEDLDLAYATYQRADSVLAAAETADPRWVEPMILRAEVAYAHSFMEAEPRDAADWVNVGIAHVERALERDPQDADALKTRGTLRYRLWILDITPSADAQDELLDQAQSDLETAVQLNPPPRELAHAHYLLSSLYYQKNDRFKAMRAAQSAFAADAFLDNIDQIIERLFWSFYDLNQITDAQEWCDTGFRRFPDRFAFAECRLWMMLTSASDPDIDVAWQTAAELVDLAPEDLAEIEDHIGRIITAGVIARADMPDSAAAVLDWAWDNLPLDEELELIGYHAVVRTMMGEYDKAVDLLTRQVAQNPAHSFDVEGDLHWWWRPLRNEPGFQSLAAPRQ